MQAEKSTGSPSKYLTRRDALFLLAGMVGSGIEVKGYGDVAKARTASAKADALLRNDQHFQTLEARAKELESLITLVPLEHESRIPLEEKIHKNWQTELCTTVSDISELEDNVYVKSGGMSATALFTDVFVSSALVSSAIVHFWYASRGKFQAPVKTRLDDTEDPDAPEHDNTQSRP
jgi:hypothetical protein